MRTGNGLGPGHLKYKAGGVVNEDVIMSVEADVENQAMIQENLATVTTEYADLYCSEARAKTEAGKSQKNVPAKSDSYGNGSTGVVK